MTKHDIVFASYGWEDFCYWWEHDRKIALRITTLIEDIRRNHYSGLGKPEPLKHQLGGAWSRRISREHRLIYEVTDTAIRIFQCRYHYRRK